MAISAGMAAGGAGSLGVLFIRMTANATELIKGMDKSVLAVEKGSSTINKAVIGMAGIVTSALTGIGALSLREFAQWESSFAGVRKTVQATEPELQQLGSTLRKMATEIPVNVNELNRIAELGGQLGISGTQNLEKFTETISKFTTATGISGEEAATSFARIANVMQEPMANIDRMGSVVAQLGDAGAATEKEILDMASRIAGAGKIAGLTSPEIFSIASAFSSAGIEAEAGGTAIQKVLLDLNGQGRRGIGEFVKFVDDLKASGTGAAEVLKELGFEDARLQRAFLSVAGAGGLLNDQLKIGNKEWQDNSRLTKEAEARYATMASQLQLTQNLLREIAITIGEALAPTLKSLNTEFQTMLKTNESTNKQIKAGAELFGTVFVGSIKLAKNILSGLLDTFRLIGMALLGLGEVFLRSWSFILGTIRTIIQGVVDAVLTGVNSAITLVNSLAGALPQKIQEALGFTRMADIKLDFQLPDVASKLDEWAEISADARRTIFQDIVSAHTETGEAIKATVDDVGDGYNEMVAQINAATKATTELTKAQQDADAMKDNTRRFQESLVAQLGAMPSANRLGHERIPGQFSNPFLEEGVGLDREMKEAEKNLEVLRQINEQEIALTADQKQKKLDLEIAYQDRMKQLRKAEYELAIVSAQNMFGDLATIAEAFAGRQSGIYKAMFAASKAFAIAESIIKIQQGIAAAAAIPWPANLAAIASVVAATANIVSTIQSVKLEFGGKREFGGSVAPGKAYLTSERGPELFVPSARGNIIPNSDLMGGGKVTVVVNNYTDARATVSESRGNDGERMIEITVKRAKDEIATEFRQGTGNVNRALEQAFNLRRGTK